MQNLSNIFLFVNYKLEIVWNNNKNNFIPTLEALISFNSLISKYSMIEKIKFNNSIEYFFLLDTETHKYVQKNIRDKLYVVNKHNANK